MTHPLFRNAVTHQDGFRDVDPMLLLEHKREVRLIDVREPHEYVGELGHIEGAELVPLGTIAGTASGWEREKDIVMICRSGARSAQASRNLVAMGFTRVMNLRGGMLAWNQAKLPIVQP